MRKRILSVILILTLLLSTCMVASAADTNSTRSKLHSKGSVEYNSNMKIDSMDLYTLADNLDLFKSRVSTQLNGMGTYFTTDNSGVPLTTKSGVYVSHKEPVASKKVDPLTLDFNSILEGIAMSQTIPTDPESYGLDAGSSIYETAKGELTFDSALGTEIPIREATEDSLAAGAAAWVNGELLLGNGKEIAAARNFVEGPNWESYSCGAGYTMPVDRDLALVYAVRTGETGNQSAPNPSITITGDGEAKKLAGGDYARSGWDVKCAVWAVSGLSVGSVVKAPGGKIIYRGEADIPVVDDSVVEEPTPTPTPEHVIRNWTSHRIDKDYTFDKDLDIVLLNLRCAESGNNDCAPVPELSYTGDGSCAELMYSAATRNGFDVKYKNYVIENVKSGDKIRCTAGSYASADILCTIAYKDNVPAPYDLILRKQSLASYGSGTRYTANYGIACMFASPASENYNSLDLTLSNCGDSFTKTPILSGDLDMVNSSNSAKFSVVALTDVNSGALSNTEEASIYSFTKCAKDTPLSAFEGTRIPIMCPVNITNPVIVKRDVSGWFTFTEDVDVAFVVRHFRHLGDTGAYFTSGGMYTKKYDIFSERYGTSGYSVSADCFANVTKGTRIYVGEHDDAVLYYYTSGSN